MSATRPRYTVSPTRIIGDDKATAQHQLGVAMQAAVHRLGDDAIPCQRDPEAWFAPEPETRFKAIRECRTNCPVIDQCRAYAHAAPAERNGIWAGQQMEPNAKVCELCGKPFGRDTTKRAQRYCSSACVGMVNQARHKRRMREAK